MTFRLLCNGTVIARGGIETAGQAKRKLKQLATTGPPGRYWVEEDGVPTYGIHATDVPKTVRVPIEGAIGIRTAFTTRTVPGQVQRKLKPGNMPWNR